MSMEGPGPSRQERSVESIPTKEEVLLEIAKHCENPTIKRELSDEKGVYLLEAEVPGEKPGETTEYIYQRKGEFSNGSKAEETIINVAYFEDGIPVGGQSVAEYDPKTKAWK
jgi:hypothetical protein